jgi:hypothetical protein
VFSPPDVSPLLNRRLSIPAAPESPVSVVIVRPAAATTSAGARWVPSRGDPWAAVPGVSRAQRRGEVPPHHAGRPPGRKWFLRCDELLSWRQPGVERGRFYKPSDQDLRGAAFLRKWRVIGCARRYRGARLITTGRARAAAAGRLQPPPARRPDLRRRPRSQGAYVRTLTFSTRSVMFKVTFGPIRCDRDPLLAAIACRRSVIPWARSPRRGRGMIQQQSRHALTAHGAVFHCAASVPDEPS